MDRCIIFLLLAGLNVSVRSSAVEHDGGKLYSPDLCKPLVIAHRGASGYVPEHTLGAYALAVTMGADYIEPDVVITKDGQLIARHKNELSLTTDVAEHLEFAGRFQTKSVDGRNISGWFSEDFTLNEIKTLKSKELMPNIRPGNTRKDGSFDVPTLKEIIDLAKGFESSERRIIGIYPEIKHPSHFQQLGLSMEKPLVEVLHKNGYRGRDAPVYIQSFEVSNLKDLKTMTELRLLQLISGRGSAVPFDQVLLGTGLTYRDMTTATGLREVASYASAVGPFKSWIIPRNSHNSLSVPTSFVQHAHAAGLKVHPHTFRAENPFLPVEFRSTDGSKTSLGDSAGEMKAYLMTGVDGLLTDQPDVLARLRGTCSHQTNSVSRNRVSIYLELFVILLWLSLVTIVRSLKV